MSFLFGKPKEEVVSIFDIGNGSIGGALVKISADNLPVVLYTHREPVTFMTQASSERLIEYMLNLLTKVAACMRKEGIPQAKKMVGHLPFNSAYCIFSSPWYVSQTHVLKVEKEKPFVVTKTLIDKLIQKEEDEFQESLRQGKYEKLFGEDVKLFEKKIIHTRLNGYEISEPIGKKARELELTFFSSFISQQILTEVKNALSHIFHFRTIEYSSYALASWSAVRDMFHDANDFLFVDITAEVTDISLTLGGVLTETISFPLGRASIIRKIVNNLLVPPEVAISFLDMYQKGTLEKKFSDKLSQVVTESLDAWYTAFTESLSNLQKFYILPRKIYCTVDPDVEKYFKDAFAKQPPKELTVLQSAFESIILNAETVRSYVQTTPEIITDSFTTLESIFINKISHATL